MLETFGYAGFFGQLSSQPPYSSLYPATAADKRWSSKVQVLT
jgi:hypothetical protein